jgi:hypothetical protein
MSRRTPRCFGGMTTHRGAAAPVKARHLYVHGGFTGTDAKFSFCFPPEEEYERRFLSSAGTRTFTSGDTAPGSVSDGRPGPSWRWTSSTARSM